MHIIDNELEEREANRNFLKVGLIGFGEMSKGLFNQINKYTPGMKVVSVYSRNYEKTELAMNELKFTNYLCCSNHIEFENAVADGKLAVTNEIDSILNIEMIDVIVELTGSIKFGLEVITKAFENKLHVVSFNAELEATFGPHIFDLANKHNVKYTLGDGDQPGVTLNLYRQVKSMGFDPLVLGNVKGMQDPYRNPKTQEKFAKSWGMSPWMATNFADGTKISMEQAAVGNAVGIGVAKRGMIGPKTSGHVDHQTHCFDYDKIKEQGGIVDYLLGAKPSPGVFIYASSEDKLSIKYLEYGKLGKGPLYSFYIPYHLLFFELAFSIARLIDFGDSTLVSNNGMKIEVVSIPKTNISAGTKLDGIGGFHCYGVCENSTIAREDNLLPIGLAEYCVLKQDVKKDHPITLDMISTEDENLFDIYFGQFSGQYGEAKLFSKYNDR